MGRHLLVVGSANADLYVQGLGAMPSLPTRAAVDAFLARASSLQPPAPSPRP